MKNTNYEEWLEMLKELNNGQPSLLELVKKQIQSYEDEQQKGNA
jgi:hypothetical protein